MWILISCHSCFQVVMFIIYHTWLNVVHFQLSWRFWSCLIKDCRQQGIFSGIAPDILFSLMILFLIKFILFLSNLMYLLSLGWATTWNCMQAMFVYRLPFFFFFAIYILCWVWLNIFYLAAVLLKQFIKQHWQEDEESFIQPVVSIEEKVISISPSHLFLDLGYYPVGSYLLGNKHPLEIRIRYLYK